MWPRVGDPWIRRSRVARTSRRPVLMNTDCFVRAGGFLPYHIVFGGHNSGYFYNFDWNVPSIFYLGIYIGDSGER